MSALPMPMQWDGETMRPVGRFAKTADREFVVGQVYRMAEIEERSAKTHANYFACLHDAWLNLPEDDHDRWPTEDHLRKFALIKVGYADERSIVCASKAEAQRVAAFIRPIDGFALVTVSECVVRIFTAQSQSMKSMGRDAFQKSKQAVLDYVAGLIGTSAEALAKNAGQAA